MAKTEIDFHDNRKSTWFVLGLVLIGVGYLTALIGCLTFYKVFWSLGLIVGGLFAATTFPKWMDRRLAFPKTGPAFVSTNVLGTIVIAGVMVLSAKLDLESLNLPPMALQSSWCVLVAAFFHLNVVVKESVPRTSRTGLPNFDYDEKQKSNPYAPSMRTERSMDESKQD